MIVRTVVCVLTVLSGCSLTYAGETDHEDETEAITFQRNLAEGAEFLEQGTKSGQTRALARFKAARAQRPESGEAYYWMGLTYSDMQNYDLAARHAEKATLCDRNLARAWLLWGQSLLYLRQWDAAKAKLDRAHQLNADDPLVSYNLGRCYFHGYDNVNDALYLFKETVRRIGDPNRAGRLGRIYLQAKLYVGACCLQKDMILAAISAFKDVLKQDKANLDARFRLGVAYRLNDRISEAERTLAVVLRQQPRHCEALLQLGHIYVVDRPNRRLAEYYLGAYLRAAPVGHAWRERVKAYLAESEKAAAGAEVRPVRDADPNER